MTMVKMLVVEFVMMAFGGYIDDDEDGDREYKLW